MKHPVLLALLLFLSGLAAMAQNTVVRIHAKDISFSRLCDSIRLKSGSRVYYSDKWTRDLKADVSEDSIQPLRLLEQVLKGTNLKVSAWNNDFVILPGVQLPSALPDYGRSSSHMDSSAVSGNALTGSEEKYLTGRKADVPQIIRVGKKGSQPVTGKVSIRGRITEEEGGEPVVGGTMYLEELKSGASSDLEGFITMVLKPGVYTAVFVSMGLETKKVQLVVNGSGDFRIEMRKTVIQMAEVVVYGDRQMNVRTKDPGLEKISARMLKEIPMLMGERDILKVSEMLPGIVTVGEGSAGLNVRGGGSDQNAFYINRIPVYNTSHVFGFFPAFNADVIKDFSIYKGYIPAQYGGRLSSVFNIIARQGNRKRFSLKSSVSPVAASLTVEGPIVKDTCSVLFSARGLYSDWILGQIKDPDIRRSKAGFSDFTFSGNYNFSRSQLTVFAYRSQDRFRLADYVNYAYYNNGASINFSRNFSTALRGEFSFTAARYAFSTEDSQDPNLAYKHAYALDDYRLTADVTWNLNAINVLKLGLLGNLFGLDRGNVLADGTQSIRIPVYLGKETGVENTIYASEDLEIFPWLKMNAGVRLTLYNPLGPSEVLKYYPDGPKDIRYIEDTLFFKKNQPLKSHFEPDVRLTFNIKTDNEGSVKLAFIQTHQNLFILNNTIALSPNAQWKLADYHIRPARGNQLSAGIFRTFPDKSWETSLECYFKKTFNAPEFIDGADFLNNPHVETMLVPADQKAWGIEFLLKRNNRKLEGWIAYTYSRVLVEANGARTWEQLNNGNAYPANFDIPHVLNTVINYHFSRRLTASGIVTYQTGKPVTYPVSIYYINEVPIVDYSDRNAYRIPDYFRIDLSVTIEGNLRKKKPVHNSLVLSLYNATGRDNPYSVYFKSEQGKIRSYQYSVIGVPLFTATWMLKLGNYVAD